MEVRHFLRWECGEELYGRDEVGSRVRQGRDELEAGDCVGLLEGRSLQVRHTSVCELALLTSATNRYIVYQFTSGLLNYTKGDGSEVHILSSLLVVVRY